MTIQENIAADQSSVAEAQAALDAANAKLASDQDALAAVQPHLSLWQEVEECAATWTGDVQADLRAIVAKARALLSA